MIPVEARTWWHALSDEARLELERSWREPAIDTSFRGHPLPIWLEGGVDGEIADEDPNRDLLEYILNHDVPFFLEGRRFHICRTHAPAKRMLRTQQIPAGFVCPVRAEACPIQFIARGRRVTLRVRRYSDPTMGEVARSEGSPRITELLMCFRGSPVH